MWQLTLSYREDGVVRLISADPISPEKTNPRSPNGQGGYMEIPVRVDWLDEKDQVTSSTETVLPVGIRVPVTDDYQPPGIIFPEQIVVLRIQGPEPDAAGRIRVSETADARGEQAPSSGTTFPVDPEIATKAIQLAGSVSATKIRDTGPDGKRLVMVFLGDGYTQAELDSGKYAADVEKTVNAFTTANPWDEMRKATNVYRVDVASNQSGTDFEVSPSGPLRDTYFHTGFHEPSVPDLLTPLEIGEDRARAAADAMVGVGVWDQIVLIVNTSAYGGGGGFLAVNSMHPLGPLISVHEVGHSFAGLADEYETPLAIYNGQPVSEANLDMNPFSPKWSLWIDSPAPPLPTPETAAYANRVGAFTGGRYNEFGIYRPSLNCRMRTLNVQFCPVCTEQHLKNFFNIVPLTDSVSPATSSTISVTSTRTFTINSIPIDDITYEWFRNGVKINGAGFASLPLSTAQLPAQTQQLTANARYTSTKMRSGAPQNSFTWTVQNNGITPANTPHWWLASHQLGVSPGEDQLDHDGDGLNTASEFIAGTDPKSRASVLKFSVSNIAPLGGTLRFHTIAGRRYRLEHTTSLDDWQSVPGYENINGNVGTVTYNPPASAAAKRFYRIAVWIP